jgi:hypothetical protein
MVKLLALMFLVLLTVTSVGVYEFIDAKIIIGEGKISDGQKKVDRGQPELDKGKARLEEGKIKLAEGKAEYEKANDNLFMVFMDKLFNHGKGFEDGRKKIAEGEKKVAQGEARISAGEKRLAAGELELKLGEEQLKMAKVLRIASALGAIIFGVISIVTAILWRRSLARVFK